jgi:ribose 5-phosphate isomerase A
MNLSQRALEFVQHGQVVGLGTGRAATAFVKALGRRFHQGLQVRGIPTSRATEELARSLGIPLVTLEDVRGIDVTVDGADEVDPQMNLIKGYGGALVREKVVAAASKRLVILVGPEKLVPVLGSRGILPIEVLPFALPVCRERLRELGCDGTPRQGDRALYVSDNANWILDCKVAPIEDPGSLDAAIRAIPGVVGTGLFLGMTSAVLVEGEDMARTAPSRP